MTGTGGQGAADGAADGLTPGDRDPHGALDKLSEYVAELFEWLAATVTGERAADSPDPEVVVAGTLEMADAARDLLAYLRAHWHPVPVPRRGGRKRTRPTRLVNLEGSINALANAWAAKRGRSRRWARGCLALLARSGAIVREPMGTGYAWRLTIPVRDSQEPAP